MGGRGRGRSRTQRKHFRDGRENVWKHSRSDSNPNNSNGDSNDNTNANNSAAWEPFATQNHAFDEYYKEQGIVGAEEWDAFIASLRKPLPSAFRINSSSQFSTDLRLQLENDFMNSLQAEVADGIEAEPIRPLPWYPGNLAWQSNFSRMQLRKNQTLERFHEFLKLENEIGNITRQEAVSMVPPLFLDVHPEHFIIDMCAAPGSKTFQLLEIIHQSSEPGLLPGGMVVANDVDVQRGNLLIHQTKRMCTANLIVTNHEAQHFPSCRLNKNSCSVSEMGETGPSISELQFDRVLCDVPCSGDGTLRKAPDIWRKWQSTISDMDTYPLFKNVGMGNGLHGLQVQIAMRGMALLKVGGRMVYSTCSMNPVENEAVVAEILRRCGGSVELVDVSNELPLLKRRPGLAQWKVCDKSSWFASYKDVPESKRASIVPSMFPSGKSDTHSALNDQGSTGSEESCESAKNGDSENDINSTDSIPPASVAEEEISSFPLQHCVRIVPHDQNSGAFFIAVFHKLSSLPAAAQEKWGHSKSTNQHSKRLSKEVNKDANNLVDNLPEGVDEKASEISESDIVSESVVSHLETNLPDSLDNKVPQTSATDVDGDPDVGLEPGVCDLSKENEWEEAQVPNDGENGQQSVRGKRKLQIQGKWRGVDPVILFKDETIIGKIKNFYGIKESFPFNGHLVSRNEDNNHVKRVYYISKSVKDVLELNLQVGQQLKITSVGLKMFERQTSKEGNASPCAFRISSEGLPLLLPYITKQILCASIVDFKHLLQYKAIKFADFTDAKFGEKASELMMGCCVIVLNDGNQPLTGPVHVDSSTIAIGCWRGRASITVMVTATDCQELLERLNIRTGEGSLVQEIEPFDVKEVGDTNVNPMEI
ncbi:SAM-dependent methyltransferase RsmB/NOP2-type [Dillenia turbinata]|uniref:SAM-dependent methyltransferase RsmB/NOP2-type n=1 Tax=Dillenia turbinata TaxID=194707 RepID=A0AAN8UWU9_9MAGN